MDREELIKIAGAYGEYIANSSKQLDEENKLQYYLCGSLATMIYGSATELSYCNVEDKKVIQLDDSVPIPPETRYSLELFARPIGDLDVLNLAGNMNENCEKTLRSNGLSLLKMAPRLTREQIPNIDKLFKAGKIRLGEDGMEGLSNSVDKHRVCKVKTVNGKEIYVASPETIIAHKLEEIICLLGAGKIKNNIEIKEKYVKDIKDLITIIDGFSKLYKNDELSKRIAESLLEKKSSSHFREYKKYLPKLLEAICRDMNSVATRNGWENDVSIENASTLLKNSFGTGLARLSDKKTELLPITTGAKGSEKKIATKQKGRDITEGAAEMRRDYNEIENPPQTKENNNVSLDE